LGSSAATRIVVALCLCVAAAAVSGLLLGEHHGEPLLVSTVNQACGNGQTSGCESVARSAWSSFAGLPVAAYGLVFYLSLSLLLALALVAPPDLREPMAGIVTALLALGLVVDLVLLGVQAFSIHAYCLFCIATYLLGAFALVALFPALRSLRAVSTAAGRRAGRPPPAGGGRRALPRARGGGAPPPPPYRPPAELRYIKTTPRGRGAKRRVLA